MSNTKNTQSNAALASLSLVTLLASLGSSIANVALSALADAFGASFGHVQWVVLAYLLGITTLIVSVGRLGDLFGRRRLMLGGLSLFMAASLVGGVAPTLAILIVARAAQGVGAAVMMTLAMALVGEAVPKARSGSAMGLLGTMSAVGTALGPSLGGVLLAAFGWRALFLVEVPFGLVALLQAFRSLPHDRREAEGDRLGFDAVGTVVLGLTLAAYAMAMTRGRGSFGVWNVALLLAAAVGGVCFGRVEARAASPLIPWATLRERALRSGLAASALVSTVMMATLVVGPFYLSRGLGLVPAMVGGVVSVGPVVAALVGTPAGVLADRVGARRVSAAGLVVLAAGCSMLSLLPQSAGVAGYVAALVAITTGYALFQTSNNTAVMAGVRADQKGVVSGTLNLSRNLGLLTGASVMGSLFALASGADDPTTADPGAVARGLRVTFAVGALLVVIALGIVRNRCVSQCATAPRAAGIAPDSAAAPARTTIGLRRVPCIRSATRRDVASFAKDVASSADVCPTMVFAPRRKEA